MNLYIFEIVFSSGSFKKKKKKKTRQNAFIVRLFNLTTMDAKENKKHTPKVYAEQKTFFIDYLWANSNFVEKKMSRII